MEKRNLLTTREVAKITGYSTEYVRELIRMDKIQSIKPNGGRIFIRRADLNDFLGEKEA